MCRQPLPARRRLEPRLVARRQRERTRPSCGIRTGDERWPRRRRLLRSTEEVVYGLRRDRIGTSKSNHQALRQPAPHFPVTSDGSSVGGSGRRRRRSDHVGDPLRSAGESANGRSLSQSERNLRAQFVIPRRQETNRPTAHTRTHATMLNASTNALLRSSFPAHCQPNSLTTVASVTTLDQTILSANNADDRWCQGGAESDERQGSLSSIGMVAIVWQRVGRRCRSAMTTISSDDRTRRCRGIGSTGSPEALVAPERQRRRYRVSECCSCGCRWASGSSITNGRVKGVGREESSRLGLRIRMSRFQ